ncbi:hypothetical protein AX15_005847 [Amanita polypyramis BW_CC]|nr:hypothetical protein AX15_005847 [Amanita polypyramis BW_CC]
MLFKTSFALLLASFLFSFLQMGVGAAPIYFKRSSGLVSVTLPLRRIQQTRNVHPLIYLQQNINHAIRRWARLTGRSTPSDAELIQNLHRRILSVEAGEGLFKRYNRMGVPSRKKLGANSAKSTNLVAEIMPQNLATGGNPDNVNQAHTPTNPNSLGLDIEGNDVAYLATIQIGSPPRDFLLLMDSGSADLWVGGENCVSEAGGGCGNHNFLGSQSSSSFQDSQRTFNVTYGTGSVAGTVVTDNLSMGNFTLPGHKFGVTDQESVEFSDNSVPFDGIMGLAGSALSQEKTLTPVEALAKAGMIQEAITSFKISRLADGKNDGEITFGALDDTKFDSGTLVTLDNLSKEGFWEAAMDAVSVNGQDAGLQGRSSILDTGTTLIVAPSEDAAAVHSLIPGAKYIGQGGFTVPCTTNVSLALTFGRTQFAIDPRDIAFQPVDPNNPNGDCASGITAGNIGGATEWLVGDVFLRNAYFSTNVNRNQLSLAKLV